MRVLILLLVLSLVMGVWSSPIDPQRWLVNRPTERSRHIKRSPQYIKGQSRGKGYNPPMPSLRKGEYLCGNRICKLKPGEVPTGCNGICQYRV